VGERAPRNGHNLMRPQSYQTSGRATCGSSERCATVGTPMPVLTYSVFPTFDRFLLLALLMGMIGDHDRRGSGSQREVCAAKPAAIVVAVQHVRTPATPSVALSASSVRHADRRPSTSRADVRCPSDRCQATGAIRVSGQTRASGVRGRCVRAVCTALDPPDVGAAGQAMFGAAGSTHRRGVGERHGCRCPHRAWREGMVVRWQCVARSRVDGRPEPPLGMRTGCGAALAVWPTKDAGLAPGAGRWAGE
jgi:hypothetical protein